MNNHNQGKEATDSDQSDVQVLLWEWGRVAKQGVDGIHVGSPSVYSYIP